MRLGIALSAWLLTLTLAGCGQVQLEDDFIFGKNRISCANQTITLEVPFEMGVQGKMADMAPKNAEKVSAEGHNQHMQILVTGELAPGKTAIAQADAASALMQNESSVVNLKETRDNVTIGSMDGVRLVFSFEDVSRTHPVDLTVKEYIFSQGDILWRVIYQYRTDDPVGQELTAQVEGKIVQGATF